jgi:hypothetical protein
VQAFSRLTGATASGLVIFFYSRLLVHPELLADPAILGVSLLFTALAVLVFVWPLWAVHRLMVAEKERAVLCAAGFPEEAWRIIDFAEPPEPRAASRAMTPGWIDRFWQRGQC